MTKMGALLTIGAVLVSSFTIAPAVSHAAPSAGASPLSALHAGLSQTGSLLAEDAEPATPATPDDKPTLTLATGQPDYQALDDEVTILIEVNNPLDQAIPEGRAYVEIAPERVTVPGDLTGGFPDQGTAVTDVSFPAIEANSAYTEQIRVSVSDLGLTEQTAAGVYRLRATYQAERQGDTLSLTGLTPVVWRDAGVSDPVQVSFIVPIMLPESVVSLPTTSQLVSLTEADGTWRALMASAEQAKATLAIDPRIIVGIRSLGDRAPDSAQSFLRLLEETETPKFLLQYGDADLAAQAALGLEKPLAPTGASFMTRFAGEPANTDNAAGDTEKDNGANAEGELPSDAGDNPNAVKTEDVTSDETGKLPDQRSFADLQQFEQTAGATAWPASGQANEATLALAESVGIQQFILDDRNVSHEGGPRASLRGGTVFVTNGAVNDAIRETLSETTSTKREHARSQAVALLALDGLDESPNVIVSLSRASMSATTSADELLDEIAGLDWIAPTPVSAQTFGRASLRSSEPDSSRIAALRSALENESVVRESGAALVNPEYLTDYQRMRLLSLFATRYAHGGMNKAAQAFADRDRELQEGVTVIPSQRAQLFGRVSVIPVQLHNSLPFPAVVHVRAAATNGAITVTDSDLGDVVIPGNGRPAVNVEVRSRITSGQSGLLLTVSTRDRVTELDRQTVQIAISSTVETIALSVLAGAAALFIGFGVWRSWRRKRSHDAHPATAAVPGD